MAAFYFFTNSASIQPQTMQQKYGPVQGNETSKYRVTSLFSSSTVQKAYAVCKGKIFAQEVNGKINIVLKPTQQPTGIFAPVKYYIYKGLMKDFLVDSDEPDYIADVTKSDLTFKIKKSQNRRNAAFDKLKGNAPNTTTTLPGINSVGLKLTAAATPPHKLLDTAFLDEVFLRVDDDEFPSVNGGDDIGQFDYLNFGFEIILDGLGEGPTLKALRNTETVITLGTTPVGDVNKFKGEDQREQILNYIDPCAFYASFFFDGIQIKADSSDAKFVPKNKDGLYNEVLAKFRTKDTVYLDLRNEHNHGFNYYRNYNLLPNDYAQFYIKYDAGSSVLTDYQSYGWPIFAISTSAFTSTDAKKPSTIVLNLPQGDNPAPMIYAAQGYFYTGFKRMSQPPDVKETLRSYIGFQADTFTEPIALSIPKLANNTTIPSYINLRYLKKINSLVPANPPVGELTLRAKHFLDNLFELTYLLDANGLKIPLDTDEITQWHITGSTAVVDSSSGYSRDYMAKVGIGRDQSNIYFFAFTEAANLVTGSTSTKSFLPVLTKAHKTNIEFGYIEILDANNVQQPVLTHNGLPDGILAPSSNPSLNVDERSMVMLALDKDELPLIQTAIGSLAQTFDKRLVLRNKHNYLDSNGNVTATEYDLFVIGYQFSSSVSVVAVNSQIKVTTKRATPRIFSSTDAALNSESLSGVIQNRKHFPRSRMQLDVDWGIRNIHNTTDDVKVASSKGIQWEFTILGKKRVFDSDEQKFYDWFYVESRQDIPELRFSKILPKGSRRWVRADQDRFYPVASFEKFTADLVALNKDLDDEQLQLGVALDTLSERITRLRQMTKEWTEKGGNVSLSKLFDEIIGSSATSPPAVRRLSDIGYVAGTPEVVDDSDFQMQHTLDTEIQLFRDYMGVECGPVEKGVVVDLHHLFVGLDVLFHADTDKYINPFVMFAGGQLDSLPQFFSFGDNVDLATWAGDIGAAPADYLNLADSDYQASLDPKLSAAQRETVLRKHFYKTRAKDDDLVPDVYAHLLHKQLLHHLQRDSSFRNLASVFYYFNLQLMSEGDKATFDLFVKYLTFDPTTPFRDQTDALDNVVAKIMAFADFWWIKNNLVLASTAYLSGNLTIPAAAHTQMLPVATSYATQFLRWIEPQK